MHLGGALHCVSYVDGSTSHRLWRLVITYVDVSSQIDDALHDVPLAWAGSFTMYEPLYGCCFKEHEEMKLTCQDQI